MYTLFRRFLSVRSTPPIFKINGYCSVQLDPSDPVVMKFALQLRQKWRDQKDEDVRADVIYLPPSTPVISLPPSNNRPEYDKESTLSHIFKRY